MSAPRRIRRRDTQRPLQGRAPGAACLVLGCAAAGLLVSAALATREPAPEARPPIARASLAAQTTAPVALPAALLQGSPSPSSVGAQPAAAASASDAAPPPAGDAPRPGTERAFYEQDLRLAARPGALVERARQLFLGGEGSDPERVAA